MDLASLTIDEFLARLASSDPTPGGGSLAALAGAMAAAMLAMVCNLTIGRPQYAEVEAEVCSILGELAERRRRLMELANLDGQAYQAVLNAYRLPRATEDERTARAAAIQESMLRATEVPVETAEAAREVLDLALRSARATNVSVLGDVAVAAHLALAAARGAADQARLNLASLTDPAFISEMQRRMDSVLATADEVTGRALQTVQTRAAAQ